MQAGRWQWPPQWAIKSITIKELLPIVLAVAMWGRLNMHQHLLDNNMAVGDIMATKTNRDSEIMHLLRCLHFFTALFDINLKVVQGKKNVVADAISHNLLQILRREAPNACLIPDPIPCPLWQLLIVAQPDWTCVDWKELLNRCARQA